MVGTLAVAIPGLLGQGRNTRPTQSIVDEDRERAPLLDDQ